MTTFGAMRRDSSYNHMTRKQKYRNMFTNYLVDGARATTHDSAYEAIKGAEFGKREFNHNYITIAEVVNG